MAGVHRLRHKLMAKKVEGESIEERALARL